MLKNPSESVTQHFSMFIMYILKSTTSTANKQDYTTRNFFTSLAILTAHESELIQISLLDTVHREIQVHKA